jgi:Fur family ferric uptake transcriptional regulator
MPPDAAGDHGGDELIHTAQRRLAEVGQRLTSGRREVIGALAAAGRPVTITEILSVHDHLAQSSTYRNLTELESVGVVRRVITHDEFTRYELAEDLTEHHHHLVCRTCGRVEDLPASPALERSVADAASAAAAATNFVVDHHRLDLIGRCADCA